MGRPVMLGNGALTVGLNEYGMVHDFYYPYVGLDNLATARSVSHKIGVWADGVFSWIDDGTWEKSVDFEEDALVSNIHLKNDSLGIELAFKDFVDSKDNVFCRMLTLRNSDERARNIRVFMHQVFQISRGGRGDTALFVPEESYILDYKGKCSLLIYGQEDGGQIFDQFAVGIYGIEGKEGTFKDAEDGELSGSAVEHGGVDSVLRFNFELQAGTEAQLEYWIVAADSQFSAEKIHLQVKKDGLQLRLDDTRKYWHNWLVTASNSLHTINKDYLTATKKSLLVIKSHIDKRGGVIASCDSSIYNYGRDYYSYVWPRDGAYVMWPLIRMGYTEEPKKFFEFCRDILAPEGYLMHKYQPDKAIGSTWHPLLHGKHRELAIQEDETAIVLFMLGEFYKHTNDTDFVQSLYATLIQPAANFMSGFIDEHTGLPHASYDLWEEKFLTNTYTTAVVYRSLLVAADFADKFEYPDDALKWRKVAETIHNGSAVFFDHDRSALRKGYLLQEDGSLAFDGTLDISSFYGVAMFGLRESDGSEISETLHQLENVLLDKSPSGGLPRYEYDTYFATQPAHMGNPWFVATLWLAQYYASKDNQEKATHYINWCLDHTLPSGVLSEQVNPNDGQSVSVSPLIWSHAELINTILDVSKI